MPYAPTQEIESVVEASLAQVARLKQAVLKSAYEVRSGRMAYALLAFC